MRCLRCFLLMLGLVPIAVGATCRLNSSSDDCLGPAVFVFANYTYQEKGWLYFHRNRFTRADNRFNPEVSPLRPWLKLIAQQPQSKRILESIQKQYVDLARRLKKLQVGRERIMRDFGKPRYVARIDENIRKLSANGDRLAQLAARFFPVIEPKLAELQAYGVLQDALTGLRGFEDRLDKMQNLPNKSLSDYNRTLEEELKKLEQAINQTGGG